MTFSKSLTKIVARADENVSDALRAHCNITARPVGGGN